MMKVSLRDRLAGSDPLLAPGVYDALGALIAAQTGFEALYLSGASIAYSRAGSPDIGLMSMTEVADALAAITERVNLPVIVDADTGFGNALNARRTVRLFERAGAAAIQLEDQTLPKRCGHLAGKSLVSKGEMVGKIKAALDARHTDQTLIVARTDAIAVEGFEPALDRAEAYLAAGADVLFIEAPQSAEQMQAITTRFQSRAPLLANMVEGGKTPVRSVEELGAIGFKLVIFPGGLARAVAKAMTDYFVSLKQHGSTRPFADRMLDFDGLNRLLGTADLLELGARYDADRQ